MKGNSMAQPEKRENSVLFSLRELREIEEKRVLDEETTARNAEAERLLAAQNAERRAKEEQEAAVRAAAESERRAREDAERRQREEQLQLQASESRARIEAQAKLDAQRLQQEMEIRKQQAANSRPTWLIATVAVLVIAGGATGYIFYQRHQEAQKVAALNAAALEEERKATEELSKKIDEALGGIAEVDARIAAAQTDAEREKLKAELAVKKAALEALKNSAPRSRPAGASQPDKPVKPRGPSCDPKKDPLCGLR